MARSPLRGHRSRSTRRRLRLAAAGLGIPGALALAALGAPSATAAVNLVKNPSLEIIDGATGFPQCWEKSGYGDNQYSFTVTGAAHSGSRAIDLTITELNTGDRKAMMLETPECAPHVTEGHQYDLSVWYTTTQPNTIITVFRHDTVTGWEWWTDLMTLPVTATWQQATVRTPPIPPNTDQITWGVTNYGVGTLVTDDYSMVDTADPVEDPPCTTGGPECVGQWQVLPTEVPARAIHSVLMHNGKVLLIAGSGNDEDLFAAGDFRTVVYDPADNSFTDVDTPEDFFCAGHVQLPDGKVLVMGGNLDYAAPDGSVGYKGLKKSYLFDPDTNSYTPTNDMLAGHWYPSATIMGNGDVISLGGLGEDSAGTVVNEHYSYAQGQWLPMGQAKQAWSFWGLYPTMILMQDGRLFYTGAHVFGNGLPGTGASIYDYDAGTITDVPGLRRKDERDEAMSVLLPPAQDQRVITMGGGNHTVEPHAHRLTDIIDLKEPSPEYVPGPDLPQGTYADGSPQTGEEGKVYVSAVILPDGKVFETGGALHTYREDPVFEASMYDPVKNTFISGMATDPVPRTYHSSSLLLPDGRVLSVGDNPIDGSFDQRLSLYSPPYLFKGSRPSITSITTLDWTYGNAHRITVDRPVVKASLIRPMAVTHSSDPNQRYVDLPMTVHENNQIDLHLTTNPNIAPPGWYMLTVVDDQGVPSVASWVKVGVPS